MAGGKETPRQKMIGMMYLVLTALLALNVSKQILRGFITVNESMETTIANLDENNKRVLESFKHAAENNPAAKPYYEKALEASKYIEEAVKYFEETKFDVIKKTDQVPNVDKTYKLDLDKGKIDDYDTPTGMLIGSDPSKMIDGEHSAKALRRKLEALVDKLTKMVDEMQQNPKTKFLKEDYEQIKKKIENLRPKDSDKIEDGLKQTWEIVNFNHLPMAAVVTNLNKMIADMKNTEAELYQVFAAASGKIALKFDKLSAKVIAPSSYIQAGQQYKADIFLAASSSAMTADMMEVLVGAEYDSITKQLKSPGNPIKIEDGMGKYEVQTSGQGEQTLKGVIKFKKPDGTYDYYPFSTTYMVAAPSVAVEPEKMNVFYIGIENPVVISAAGVSPTDLVVSISGAGGKTIPKGGGKYIVTVTTPGECKISVSAKTKDGIKPQGPPKVFRVKRIPDPLPKIGGVVANGTIEMNKVTFSSINSIGVELINFDFDVKFTVV
ncbi:MAG: gliding motility protein GldM, partial [Bacteroidia bacterium]|nr:gliding motility protein GldM [Bacteroidia bacterium]